MWRITAAHLFKPICISCSDTQMESNVFLRFSEVMFHSVWLWHSRLLAYILLNMYVYPAPRWGPLLLEHAVFYHCWRAAEFFLFLLFNLDDVPYRSCKFNSVQYSFFIYCNTSKWFDITTNKKIYDLSLVFIVLVVKTRLGTLYFHMLH